jgi:pyruvate formate lyase activating enzyme
LQLLEQLTAVKIDLKGFTENYYEEVCHGKLQPVLDTLKRIKKEGKWFELVNLIVPTLNDDREKLTEMCKWIAGELGVDVPIHFSRFHPTYKIQNLPQTPVPTLEMAVEVAKGAGLHYPYIGNVPGHKYESTYCPECGEMVIYRYGYHVDVKNMKDGCCGKCGEKIAGIWKAA